MEDESIGMRGMTAWLGLVPWHGATGGRKARDRARRSTLQEGAWRPEYTREEDPHTGRDTGRPMRHGSSSEGQDGGHVQRSSAVRNFERPYPE